MKDSIAYYAESEKQSKSREIKYLRDVFFYVEKEGLLSDRELPMPPSTMAATLQGQIGTRTLTDSALRPWFEPVPLEIWMDFMSQHQCITEGRPEDDKLRLKVLSIFSKEYERKYGGERVAFGVFCKRLLHDKTCIPLDCDEPSQRAADLPGSEFLID